MPTLPTLSSVTYAITAATTWPMWNASYSVTTSSSAAVNGSILLTTWANWAASYTTNTTSLTTNTWSQWVEFEYVQQGVARNAMPRNAKPSDEEVRRRLEQEKRWREEAAAREAAKRLAEARAEKLLVDSLTAEQREDLSKKGCFYLTALSKDGKARKYRIDRGTHGNVKLLDEKGSIEGSYCAQPQGVPVADSMLAQKLMLETNEAEFRRVANFRRHG